MSRHYEPGRVPGQLAARRSPLPRIAVASILALAFPLSAAAQGAKDDLWEVTVKMEMPGMPMAMPPQTSRVCAAKNSKDEDYVPKQGNCKMLESKRAGSKLTYKMACDGKNAMTVNGEIVYATNSYEGKSRMSGQMDGQPMEMTQTFSGKRVGDCTATK
jgi:hypothetical protein